jgi:hypothetical protein
VTVPVGENFIRDELRFARIEIARLQGEVERLTRERNNYERDYFRALVERDEAGARAESASEILDDHEGNPALAVMLAREALAPGEKEPQP